jgi:hypothetical protein
MPERFSDDEFQYQNGDYNHSYCDMIFTLIKDGCECLFHNFCYKTIGDKQAAQ